jgi:hypothetical protein
VGFDLAADFLYSIVIPVDLMTFQTGDIRNASKKLAGAALGGAVYTIFPQSTDACIDRRYSQTGQVSQNVPDNYFVINILGV